MQEQITPSQQIITIYCLCDDFLRAWGHTDDPQAQMTTAEVMTVALVAAALCGGDHERSRLLLKEHGYIKAMLSKSRLNRRLHAVPEAAWQALFALLGEAHKQINENRMNENQRDEASVYAVDSMPVPVCDNIRIRRCHLYPRRRHGETFRGYTASEALKLASAKRRYFYGLRLHLVVTAGGLPVEAVLLPGAVADVTGLKCLPLDLAPGATLLADAGYTDYAWEDGLSDEAGIHLVSVRRGNSKRPLAPWLTYLCQRLRQPVETVFSGLRAALAGHVHAVTPRGFELKVFLTVLAYSILA